MSAAMVRVAKQETDDADGISHGHQTKAHRIRRVIN